MIDREIKQFLENKALWARRKVLEMSVAAHSGHVSTAFSQMEMAIALYQGKILNVDPENPKWDGRDRFILSKGQGGIGMYPVLADMGFFPMEELDRFAKEGGILGVHAEWNIPGVEVLTGSLGHGLPMAVGMAHAARLAGKEHFIVCMLGDGELYEGSNWEAMFTAGGAYNPHSQVGQYGHLIVIVDNNKQSTIGFHDEQKFASDGPGLGDLIAKFLAFGFDTWDVLDGHNFEYIFEPFTRLKNKAQDLIAPPLCIISHTDKGHGASVMENKRLWHYRVPGGEDLIQTRKDLGLEKFSRRCCANRLFGSNPDCSEYFDAKPSSNQECCSRKCSSEYKRRGMERRKSWTKRTG